MFGIYRYFLAIVVVVTHLAPHTNLLAGNAVFAFYVLSGFLMTLILDKNYGWNSFGVKKYLLNRFTRIYPTYYAVMLLALIILFVLPENTIINKAISFPQDIESWIRNITIIGLGPFLGEHLYKVRLVPPAWALHVECIFYLLIPLLARNILTTFIWFVISVIIMLYMYYTNFHYTFIYYTAFGGTVAFSLGSMTYYYLTSKIDIIKKTRHIFFTKVTFLIALILVVILILYPVTPVQFPTYIAHYINIFLQPFIIVYLYSVDKKKLSFTIRELDKRLGELSYPIYLVHWHIAILCISLFFGSRFSRSSFSDSLNLLIISFPLINLFAFLIYTIVDRRLMVVRNKIRGFVLKY